MNIDSSAITIFDHHKFSNNNITRLARIQNFNKKHYNSQPKVDGKRVNQLSLINKVMIVFNF